MVGTKKCLSHLQRISDAIKNGVPNAIDEYVQKRVGIAQAGYASAQYHEHKDVDVGYTRDKNTWTMTASGESLLFIEFGTGIVYPRTNPLEHPYNFAGSWSIEHGQYLTDSEKLAKYRGGWPLNGRVVYGNPSANVMYEETKAVRDFLPMTVEVTLGDAIK